jgi:hypothetical protein
MNMNMFGLTSTTTPIAVPGVGVEKNPEDIPKEELMQLCMKMNKRMQAMETKGKELVKKKTSLLNDRHKLLELINNVMNLPLSSPEDQDLDFNIIESSWFKWDSARKELMNEYEQKLLLSEQTMASKLSSQEIRHRKEISEVQRTSRMSSAVGDGMDSVLTTASFESPNVNDDLQHQLENLHSEKAVRKRN